MIIIKLILGLGLIFLILWMMKTVKKLSPEKKKAFLLKCALFGFIALILIGLITHRMNWLGAALVGALTFLRFGASTIAKVIPFWLHQTGGIAPFKTEYLDVKVSVQKGTISGFIINGPMAGSAIEDLKDDTLAELEIYYKDRDAKSYYLIKFARKASFGKSQGHQQPPSFGDPSRDEALQILGLKGNPTKDEIIQAHRRLINRLHPDRGGSDFLAARVNQARDILLK